MNHVTDRCQSDSKQSLNVNIKGYFSNIRIISMKKIQFKLNLDWN